jgi:predicted kinase
MITLALPDPCLVVLLGASGAGKSTLADALAAQHPDAEVISYDACREELTGNPNDQDATAAAVGLAHIRVAARCAAQVTTVVDATHTQFQPRHALRTMAAQHGLPAVAVAVATPLDVCLARQLDRPPAEPGVRWGAQVPAEKVTVQHAELTAALPALHIEGFDQVHILDGRPSGGDGR